jgi:hypothetical protein
MPGPYYSAPHPKGISIRRAEPEAPSREAEIGAHIKPQPDGCWLYNGEADKYHTIFWRGRTQPAHRVVYEILVDEIPDGLHLHHNCETPGCVNPEHLEPVTPGEHRTIHAMSS